MMSRIAGFVMVASIAVAILSSACAQTGGPVASKAAAAPTNAAQPASAQSGPQAIKPLNPPVKVVVAPGATVASSATPYIVARDKGYFKEEGLNIQEVDTASLEQAIPSVATGQVDAALGAVTAAIFNALASKSELKIVMFNTVSLKDRTADGLLVRKDLWDGGQIRKISDLKGRKVGVSAAANHEVLALGLALEAAGLSLHDVDLVQLTIPDITVALKNKSIDAAMQPDPPRVISVEQGYAVNFKNVDEMLGSGVPITAWVFSNKFRAEHPEAGERFITAIMRGARDYADAMWYKKANRPEMLQILSKQTGIKDLSMFDKATVSPVNVDGEMDVKPLINEQDWFAKEGFVKQKVDLSKYVDSFAVDYAEKRLGKYKP